MALKIWYASPDLASADLKQLCSSPDEGFEPSRRILKDDKTTTLHFIDLDGAKGHQFRWKHRQAVQKDANRFMKNWQNNPMLKEKFGLALVDCGLKDIK